MLGMSNITFLLFIIFRVCQITTAFLITTCVTEAPKHVGFCSLWQEWH